MLHIRDLSIRHRVDDRILIENLTCHLHAGDCAVLIGEEGNGKSTLLQLLASHAGVLAVPEYISWTGTVEVGGVVGYLPQMLSVDDRSKSVYDYMLDAAVPDPYDMSGWAGAAVELGLSPDLLYSAQTMESLSGGEKIKVQLARLLLLQPDVWLLDEPSNDLDLAMLAWLEEFMVERPELTLYVSHDETLIRRTADVVIHLEQIWRKTEARSTVARLGYGEYVEQREAGFEKQDRLARKEESEYRAKEERFRQIRDRVEHEQNTISRQDPAGGRLLKKKMKSVQSLGRRMEKAYESRTRVSDSEDAILAFFDEGVVMPAGKEVLRLSVDALVVPGESRVLARGVELVVSGAEKVAIVGTNGSGKTTLLRLIAEKLLARSDVRAGYMPQNYMDALEEAAGLPPVDYLVPSGNREMRQQALDHLGSMRYTHLEMTRPVAELSGGQKAKLLILRMILEGCDVLVLDEPTRNFSPLSAPVIREILAAYGGAVIAVSHDRLFLAEVPDVVYELTAEGLSLYQVANPDGS